MGVLEFFGTLIKNDITSSSIVNNFDKTMKINYLLLDFNSIIHVSSQKILGEINSFMKKVLESVNGGSNADNIVLLELFEKYNMMNIKKKINKSTPPLRIINLFHKHFTQHLLDKMIIILTIKTIKHILRTYCENDAIELLMLAIDGVPSKGKLIEQRHRKYTGAFIEKYKQKTLKSFKKELLNTDKFTYYSIKKQIHWSRVKITPGTRFMYKIEHHLRTNKIQEYLRGDAKFDIVITDTHEIGEGEKKIINYINNFFPNTDKNIVIYSPDADMILLSMLLSIKNVYVLRHDPQTSQYDLINVNSLKQNISYYLNNKANKKYDCNSINRDIVCISTLFGNDFVPKLETMNVKRNFKNIINAYEKALSHFDNNIYLVNYNKAGSKYEINLEFLKLIMHELLRYEIDFIKYNDLYNEYINIGQIKNVFADIEITRENLTFVVNDFKMKYGSLKNTFIQGNSYANYASDTSFINSVKESVNVEFDGKSVNLTNLSNIEVIRQLKKYYDAYRDLPRLNINLNKYSRSINTPVHKNRMNEKKIKSAYAIEIYKIDNMLDEYYEKFNASPLILDEEHIDEYYEKYFHTKSINKQNKLSIEAIPIMYDYIEGIMWTFEYYNNDNSYINTWYYKHERAPLLKHIYMYLSSIDQKTLNNIQESLVKYKPNIHNYFNPVEQLIYVSPYQKSTLELLPPSFKTYFDEGKKNPFFDVFFFDIDTFVDRVWDAEIASDMDCHSIPYLNKCMMAPLLKPTAQDDIEFLKNIRKIPRDEEYEKRSLSNAPKY